MTDRRGRFWLPALAVLVVCSAAAFMAGRRQGARPGRGEGAEGAALADLRDEVARLRERVRGSEALAGAAAMAAAQKARPAEGAAAPAGVN
ncbi:MAG TPA: hypothetical protein VHO06_00345, partial [Polyangia bacterium]|nr:hypothetical protein [Polyangia bacterium]